MWLALVKALDNVDIMTDCNYTTALDTLLKPQGIIENCSINFYGAIYSECKPCQKFCHNGKIADACTALKFNKSEIIEVKK